MLQKPFTGERMGAPPPSRASIRSTEISSLLFLMSQSVTIIGIDPGSRNTGWGVVREVSGVLQLVDCGVIRPPLDGEFASRLGVIFKEMHRVLGRLKPDEASVEQVFTAQERGDRGSSSVRLAVRPLRPVRPMICLCGTTNPR